MPPRMLVAYATHAGSMVAAAESIAEMLRAWGAAVDALPFREIANPGHYQAVVIGSTLRIGRLMPETYDFVRQHRRALAPLPSAYFVVCASGWRDTPQNRQTVQCCMTPLVRLKPPVSTLLCSGPLDRAAAEPPFRRLFMCVHEANTEHDWEMVRAAAAAPA